MGDPLTLHAIEVLRERFANPRRTGPKNVAYFLYEEDDEDLQAQAVGFVQDMLIAAGVA